MWWKLAGGMAVGALLIIGLIVARPSRKDPDTNPTQSTQPQTLSTKSTTGNNYANLPPAGQMFPPGTVAAAVVYPQPFWKFKELKPDGELVKFIESIAGRSKFDPRLFDRGTTSFSASPGVYTATGEGRFLTPEWEAGLKTMNAKEVEPPPRAPERMKLYGFGTWTTGPRFATLIEGRAYAVSSDIQRLAALYRSLEGKIGPKLATLDPELLAAFPAPTDSDLPIVTFVSTGTWVFPDGKSLTLDKHGVQFLSVNLRLRNEFEGTILLVGSDKNKLKDFISLVLITNLVSQYPALKPLALELGRRYETAPAPLANGLYRMTINVTFSRGDLVNAIEGLLAPAP